MRIDLNSDMGEAFGPWPMGDDEVLLTVVTSANVACGFHAGDPRVMRDTVRRAARHGVRVGAHPGFPDLAGFGRREMQMRPADVEDAVIYQIGALAAVAGAEGVRLAHVKPHGALYNMAWRDRAMADAIARGVAAVSTDLALFAPAGSALAAAGHDAGLTVVAEGFADRAYLADGTLASRATAGAVLTDEAAIVARAVEMAVHGRVMTVAGTPLDLAVETLCVHSDTPGAGRLAAAIREGLTRAGVTIAAWERRRAEV
ncbi:MAG: LamB/YcsF family protein [Acidobacteria bacterium]|nr:LamB/YcsF family protein [Acidobacteriota bacterium]